MATLAAVATRGRVDRLVEDPGPGNQSTEQMDLVPVEYDPSRIPLSEGNGWTQLKNLCIPAILESEICLDRMFSVVGWLVSGPHLLSVGFTF